MPRLPCKRFAISICWGPQQADTLAGYWTLQRPGPSLFVAPRCPAAHHCRRPRLEPMIQGRSGACPVDRSSISHVKSCVPGPRPHRYNKSTAGPPAYGLSLLSVQLQTTAIGSVVRPSVLPPLPLSHVLAGFRPYTISASMYEWTRVNLNSLRTLARRTCTCSGTSP
jgi:hypothetical protein